MWRPFLSPVPLGPDVFRPHSDRLAATVVVVAEAGLRLFATRRYRAELPRRAGHAHLSPGEAGNVAPWTARVGAEGLRLGGGSWRR